MRFVNSKQVFNMLKEDKLSLIIDVRDTSDYNLGHIPNSINIPSDNISYKMKSLMEYKNQPILIYCSKGHRSATVSKYLENKGFSNIYNLLNGYDNYSYKVV